MAYQSDSQTRTISKSLGYIFQLYLIFWVCSSWNRFLKNPMSFRKMTETLTEPEADETEVKLEDIPLDEDEPQTTVL